MVTFWVPAWGAVEVIRESRVLAYQICPTKPTSIEGLIRIGAMNQLLSEILGSHSGEYEDGCLLGCSTV
jgi:hypothetical protein